ncbi:MAG TPA: tetratricopeptide repeat protein [Gemmatimonadaceae bacterium]|nr:tetratricopeptide repeat protein [Gemmatimonadaceae bacterium]
MSNVAKLKKQAAELELKKQFDKAIAVYVKLLESFDEHADELDVGLFNRVGDLMLRQGNVADAVDYYEQAVDRYADTGFFNNAIALCNKILRHSPGRASVYYKLGRISAQKGFKNDAKVNFLEYADRMQKSGRIDEAFRALKEFADLCPDQDDIRLMLADQLTKADRKDEAIEQLQTLYERYDAEGRSAEAAATADRMRAIDPSVEPRAGSGTQKSSSGDLIFLDLDAPTPASRASVSMPAPQAPPPRPSVPVAPAMPTPPEPAAAIEQSIDEPLTATPDRGTPLAGITRVDDGAVSFEKTPSESLLGLESTRLADDDLIRQTPSSSLLDVEPTSLVDEPATPVHRSSQPTHAMLEQDEEAPSGGDLELILPEPDEPKPERRVSIEFDASALTTPPAPADLPPLSAPTPPSAPAALDGLPLMDIDVPVAPTPGPMPRVSRPLEELSFDEDLELVGAEDESDAFVDLNAESLTADDEPVTVPTPSIARRSTMVAVQSVEILKASVEGEPENWGLRRELAEAMLEAGDRDGGIRELESAMAGAERSNDLELASSLAEEIARLEPEAVKHHQKRVEYAFRTNDRGRLIEAYLALADALLRSDQPDKARTVYQRVIDLAPDELRARTALDAIVVPEPEPAPPPPPRVSGARRSTMAMPIPPAAAAPVSSDFVNLGDWLRDDDGPKDTRMVVAEQEPTGDEDADFADMLRKFKQGVAENVDPEDYQSHYDLAIAYKEMGLLDEAIAEFQKALGSPVNRLPTYEALGQCFLDKGQAKLASSILSRALTEPSSEELLVGVLYLLGRAAEAQGNADEALAYYQRVFILDIQFRDIAERMNELERAAR